MAVLKTRLLNQLTLIAIIVALGYLILKELAPYFYGVLGAITFYFLMKGSMKRLENRGWRKDVSAAVLMILSFIIILVPIAGIIMMLINKVGAATSYFENVLQIVKNEVSTFEETVGINIISNIDNAKVSNWITKNASGLAGSTINTFIGVGILYFILYYMLVNRQTLGEQLTKYIPLKNQNIKTLGKETRDMVRANAIGIPVVALCQGVIALIGYLIFGTPDPMFWFVITTIGAVVPIIGTALGYIPVVIIMLSTGQTWQAIAVLLYSVIIVGSTDNIIRLVVLKKLSDVHPLVTLIGVIIGVPLFGFIGLIFGPLLISLFLLAMKIYRAQYIDEDIEAIPPKNPVKV